MYTSLFTHTRGTAYHTIFVKNSLYAQVALKLFCSNQVFPHGSNIVPSRLFTVENESKETDNDDKIAETAKTDVCIDERL